MAVTPPSNLNPNSAPWGRWVEDTLRNILNDSSRNTGDQSVTNRMLNSSINTLTQQINKAPLGLSSTFIDTSQLAPGSSMTQVAIISFLVPTGKTLASIFAIANAQYLDRTSGGSAFAEGRVGVRMRNSSTGGSTAYNYSITARAAKDAGASAVVNILSPAVSAQYSTTNYDYVDVVFEAYVSNTGAFSGSSPTNQSQLSATVTFTA